MKKRWKVKWDSGGCGSDIWGYIDADTREEAEDIMKAQYFNGNPHNDDNLFVVEVQEQKQKQSLIYHQTIEFPNEEALKQYEEKMKELGFNTIYSGPTINIEEVKKRRFNK